MIFVSVNWRFACLSLSAVLLCGSVPGRLAAALPSKEKIPETATVELHAGQAECSVELDADARSKTGADGALILESVEPGDHYLHVSCPNGLSRSILISPRVGETLQVSDAENAPSPAAGLEPAEIKQRLLAHIQESIRLRARGRIEEAAEHLRDARQLDPENSDLHRELGITFLLGKDWKRARIEMLEAIRYDHDDAEAYNGLGYAREKLGDIEGAIDSFRIAMRLDPGDSTYRRHYFDGLAKLAAKNAEKKK
jgi:tetratricopeptide (TPR) repeat protein